MSQWVVYTPHSEKLYWELGGLSPGPGTSSICWALAFLLYHVSPGSTPGPPRGWRRVSAGGHAAWAASSCPGGCHLDFPGVGHATSS